MGDRAGSGLREDPSIAAARSQNSRTGSVERTRIIESLEDSIGVRLVSIRAPAGYGKTTLLSQWAEVDPRPTAWLTLDRYHNDPRHLVEELAKTMASCGMIDIDESTVLRRIGGDVDRLVERIAPREPSLMMLDEGEAIGRPESRDVIARLAESTPPMMTVVVASRTDIGLPSPYSGPAAAWWSYRPTTSP